MPVSSTSPPAVHATTLADVAIDLAAEDGVPPRKSVYLRPLQTLRQRCTEHSPDAIADAVHDLTHGVTALGVRRTPSLVALRALTAAVRPNTSCSARVKAIGREILGRLDRSGSRYATTIRFSPPLTADLALAMIRHALFPGRVHVVYALRAYSCQQAIYMGPPTTRLYGNPDLGAFVKLTSGRGVGHGKYDANRVNLARVGPLGRHGGQPC
jgi:hypothetical protein